MVCLRENRIVIAGDEDRVRSGLKRELPECLCVGGSLLALFAKEHFHGVAIEHHAFSPFQQRHQLTEVPHMAAAFAKVNVGKNARHPVDF